MYMFSTTLGISRSIHVYETDYFMSPLTSAHGRSGFETSNRVKLSSSWGKERRYIIEGIY